MWSGEFQLPDGFYSMSDIQDYVEYIINLKYNCSGPLTFKRQRAEYQSNQKVLHHYQHLNSHQQSAIQIFILKIQQILGSHEPEELFHF